MAARWNSCPTPSTSSARPSPRCDTRDDTAAFLRDACTLSELEAIGHRLAGGAAARRRRHDVHRDRPRRRHLDHHRHARGALAAARLPAATGIVLDRARRARLMRPLRIALPSKGRMAEPAQRLLRDAGFEFEPDGRRLRVPLPDQDAEILFARADDIPVLGRGPRGRLRHRGRQPGGRVGRRAGRAAARSGSGAAGCVVAAPAGSQITSARRPRRRAHRHLVPRHRRPLPGRRSASRRRASRSPARWSWRRRWTPPRRSPTSCRAARRCARTGSSSSRPSWSPRPCCSRRAGSTRPPRQRVAELVLVLRSVLAARPKRYLMLNAHDDHLDGHRRPPPRSRRADGAAAGARRHARRARCRRCGRGRPPPRAAEAGRSHRHPRPPDRAPHPMTLPDIPFVRPELARPAPYRWQDNVPRRPGLAVRHEHAAAVAGGVARDRRAGVAAAVVRRTRRPPTGRCARRSAATPASTGRRSCPAPAATSCC